MTIVNIDVCSVFHNDATYQHRMIFLSPGVYRVDKLIFKTTRIGTGVIHTPMIES